MAPALHGWGQKLTLPDLQVWWPKTRQTTWVEVKCKSTCGVVRVMNNLQTTGIDLAKYSDYEAVERMTGCAVLLVFLHRAQDAVLLADLHTHRVRALGAGKQMVFWDMARLTRLCSYQELMQTTPRKQGIEEPLFSPPPPAPTQLGLF
jgi:23S rRNA A2030 N6-methylase RlmJ